MQEDTTKIIPAHYSTSNLLVGEEIELEFTYTTKYTTNASKMKIKFECTADGGDCAI